MVTVNNGCIYLDKLDYLLFLTTFFCITFRNEKYLMLLNAIISQIIQCENVQLLIFLVYQHGLFIKGLVFRLQYIELFHFLNDGLELLTSLFPKLHYRAIAKNTCIGKITFLSCPRAGWFFLTTHINNTLFMWTVLPQKIPFSGLLTPPKCVHTYTHAHTHEDTLFSNIINL